MQSLETWAEALADQRQGSRAPLDLLLNTCQSKHTGPLRPADSLSTPRGQAAAFEQGLSTTWSSRQPDGIFLGLCIAFTHAGRIDQPQIVAGTYTGMHASAEAEVQAVLPLCTYLTRSEGKVGLQLMIGLAAAIIVIAYQQSCSCMLRLIRCMLQLDISHAGCR